MASYLSPKFVVQTAFLVAVCYLCTNFVATSFEKKKNNLKENDNEIVEEKWTKETFKDFDNDTGTDRFIVPNIIHFIRFNQTEYSFIDYVVIKAAMRNHRPDFFYIHTNVAIPHFTGRYWELIKKDYEIFSRIRFFHLDLPSEIFGQPLNISLYFKFNE